MKPREHARTFEDEDMPLSSEQLAAFRAELERLDADGRFASGTDDSPEAEARRKFLEELDAADV